MHIEAGVGQFVGNNGLENFGDFLYPMKWADPKQPKNATYSDEFTVKFCRQRFLSVVKRW